MNTTPKINLLTTNLFLVGLFMLLLNDFYLKYEYSNSITGKLSDFSGLFIFPYFISIFFRRTLFVYIITSILFIYWKLEYSQPIIEFTAKILNLGIHRTVDYTDLFALIVLPPSYFYFQKKKMETINNRPVFSFSVCIMAIFSFCATSQPRQTFTPDIKSSKSFLLPFSKTDLLSNRLHFSWGLSSIPSRYSSDSLFYLYFRIPEYNSHVTAIAKIKTHGKDSSEIKLECFSEYEVYGKLFIGIKQSDIESLNSMTTNDFELGFSKNFIDEISNQEHNDSHLYFDDKVIKDSLELEYKKNNPNI